MEVFESRDWACQSCGDQIKGLHLHRCYDQLELDPWDYPLDSLKCLCGECHKARGETEIRIQEFLALFTLPELKAILETLPLLYQHPARDAIKALKVLGRPAHP